MEFHELEEICRKNVCGETVEGGICGGELNVAWLKGEYHIRCEKHIDPLLSRAKGYWEMVKSGEAVPLHVLNVIQKKMESQEKERRSK